MYKSKEIAKLLLDIKAVTLSPKAPYTWASGIKSPIYCDNRLTISYPKVRKIISEELVKLIKNEYPEVEAIVGTATAGIPQAAWVSDMMELPMAYVRSSSKAHGKNNQIEGQLKAGTKVVVIEDLISTGGSSIQACEALIEAGIEVLSVVSIFSYEMLKASENFKKANINFKSLVTLSILKEEAVKLNYINDDSLDSIALWAQDPEEYTKQYL